MNKNKGLTLIETLLYIALLSIFIVMAIPLMINLNMWQSRQTALADANREFLFIEAKVRNVLQEGEDVGDKIFLEDGIAKIRENEDAATALHNPSITVGALNFYHSQNQYFDTLDFSLTINGLHFGTTTFPFHHE